MPVTPFSAGFFNVLGNLAEWDGSNHADILAWIVGQDIWTTDPAQQWFISSVSASSVTFARPAWTGPYEDRPADYPYTDGGEVSVGVGEWIAAFRPGSPTPPQYILVMRVDRAGKWKTTDPFGRPAASGDLLVAGSEAATETLRPNAVSDRNQHSVTGTSAVAAVFDDLDTSYLRNNTGTTLEDRFNLTAPSAVTSGDTITSIDVRYRARTETDPGTGTVTVGLRLGTTNSLAAAQGAIATSPRDLVRTAIPRPGGGSWTFADLADLQVVVLSNNGTAAAVRIFGLWVDIHY